jgi:methionyl-tRNA formyltransferase
MFDTVILLTSAVVQPILQSVLSAHNPHLTIISAETLADLNAIEPDTLTRARLIAFVTAVIVPANVLEGLGYGAYNFHPGPPAYPGWAPAHFALYQRAGEFGATAHVMAARVDEGPIVGVEMFSIPPGISVAGLEGMTYARLCYLFWTLARPMATCSERLPELNLLWSGKKSTRHDYATLCDIPLDIQRDELERRIEVFGADPDFGSRRTFMCTA